MIHPDSNQLQRHPVQQGHCFKETSGINPSAEEQATAIIMAFGYQGRFILASATSSATPSSRVPTGQPT
jgi:hypothetical protein